jgi:type II secretory pathway pseudopilin PulG
MEEAPTTPTRAWPRLFAETGIALALVVLLAGIGTVGWQRAARRAHVRQAVAFLKDLAERQRTYRLEHHRFAATGNDVQDFWPRDMGNGQSNIWGLDCRKKGDVASHPGWCALELEIRPDERVWFQFVVLAKDPAKPWKPPEADVRKPQNDWWIAKARADLDGDGQFSDLTLTSEMKEPRLVDELE